MSLPFMSTPPGYKANERPEAFCFDAVMKETELTGVYRIEVVEDRW